MYFRRIIQFLILIAPVIIFAQNVTQIRLVQAKTQEFDKQIGEMQRFKGSVIIEHEGAFLYCDSAWLYDKTNSIETFGRSRIKVNDTVSLLGNHLNYDGNTRIVTVTGNVILKDNKSSIKSEKMIFDRNTNISYYNTGGILKDSSNTLTSKIGKYNTLNKETFFKDNVVLVNSRYKITTDTLMYNTKTEVAYFFSPTNMISNENRAYCELGWYDTKTDKSVLQNNAYLSNKNQTIKGDSLYYDKINGYGLGYHNVQISDSIKNVIFKGNFAEYHEKGGFSYVADSALAIMIENIDTLYLHADTLKVLFDTAQNPQSVYCYNHAKFFRTDLQGKCDSIVYLVTDSMMTMYSQPLIWSGENQLVADTIVFFLKNKKLDRMLLRNSAFIVSAVDVSRFNQIKGKNMEGFFVENKINLMNVLGNAESLYYATDEAEKLVGVNKTESSFMDLYFENNKVTSILVSGVPKSIMYPESKMDTNDSKLRNFTWQIDSRPFTWQEIFKKTNVSVSKKLKFN